MRAYLWSAGLCAAIAAAGAAQAQPAEPLPPAFVKLADCRLVADAGERLACYDREMAAVAAAQARRELVVVDRQQIRNTRKTLFGLALPNLSIFGNDSDDEEGISRIETRIRTASQNAFGRWMLDLEEGGRWVQVDSRNLGSDPRNGQPIRIRKGAMGSYFANINGQIAIKVRRVN